MVESKDAERETTLIGDMFPHMEVWTTHGKMTLPEDKAGKWFILFSHPGDFTPVCTTEFYSFTKMSDDFNKLNTDLIGLSIDQVHSHIKWVEWINENLDVEVPFPIIADALGTVATRLGMVHPGKGSNTVRSVFIVDDKGVIRLIIYYPQEVGRNMEEILRALKALQVSDANNVAMPANWPKNELLGDKVIVRSAADEATAKERKKTYDNYDWWFCYRSL
ncbi:MAG: peroxiredoxin [Methanomassiliicoccus sp.]|nr:peroxiredoxin [Methanomassiliicoccus sp.]